MNAQLRRVARGARTMPAFTAACFGAGIGFCLVLAVLDSSWRDVVAGLPVVAAVLVNAWRYGK